MRVAFIVLVFLGLGSGGAVYAGPLEDKALLAATAAGALAPLQEALDRGADPNARQQNPEQFTALIMATQAGHLELVRVLLKQGASPNYASKSGFTPLMFAAYYDRTDMIELLLNSGADLAARNALDGNSVVHVAAQRGNVRSLTYLLKHGGDPNIETGTDGRSPIMLAAREAYGLSAVVELIAMNANVNHQAWDGTTALMGAAIRGYPHITETLILNKADVNAVSKDGRSALHRAAMTGRKEIVDQLLRNGANVELRAKDGDTPLGAAVFYGQTAVIQRFVQSGAKVNAPARGGETPLMLSVRGNHPEIAGFLLQQGADVNASSEKATALYLAAERGLADIVDSLLAAGADVDYRDPQGNTALSVAKEIESTQTVALLRKAGAKN